MACLHAGFALAFLVRFGPTVHPENLEAYARVAPWVSLTLAGFTHVYGLYSYRRRPWNDILYSVVSAYLLSFLAFMAISFFARGFAFPRSVFVLGAAFHLLLLPAWRFATWRLHVKLDQKLRLLIFAGEDEAQQIAAKLAQEDTFYEVAGVLTPGELAATTASATMDSSTVEALPWEAVFGPEVDGLLVGPGVQPPIRETVVDYCLWHNRVVLLVPELYDILLLQARLLQIDDTPLLELAPPALPARFRLAKRAMDLVLATLGLALALPVMAAIALAIKLDSRGPVFFTQERTSELGRTFRILKFRTMMDDAELETGPVLAAPNDPRITRVGRVLRLTRLDELPQLINVLKGDMSFVGPRPERPVFVEQLATEIPTYRYRMRLRAGLTGLAQVAGKYDTSPRDKLRYDLLYAGSYSPLLDLRILLQTLKAILMREKAS